LRDNGLEFTDKYSRGKGKVSGNHKFDIECKEDRIEHRLTALYTPQTNGIVERVNKTLKMLQLKPKSMMILKMLKKI
jgi:transposase InsO family protein